MHTADIDGGVPNEQPSNSINSGKIRQGRENRDIRKNPL
jgi:hypothetical protein